MIKLIHLIKDTIIALFMSAVLILGLEIACRVLQPKIVFVGKDSSSIERNKYGPGTHGSKSNYEWRSWGAIIQTDEHGFRINPESNPEKGPLLPSIVILGDSVGIGVGVDADKTFSELLANKLQTYKIFNSSVTGYTIKNYKHVIEGFILPLKDDFKIEQVLLFYTLNDISNHSAASIENSLQLPHGPEAKPRKPLLEIRTGVVTAAKKIAKALDFHSFLMPRSKLYLFVKSLFIDSSRNWFMGDFNHYENETLVTETISALSNLRQMLKSANIRLTVFLIPYEYQLRIKDPELLTPQRKILNGLKENNITAHDLYASFVEEMDIKKDSSQELFLFNDHCHLSALGHKYVAKLVSEKLQPLHRR